MIFLSGWDLAMDTNLTFTPVGDEGLFAVDAVKFAFDFERAFDAVKLTRTDGPPQRWVTATILFPFAPSSAGIEGGLSTDAQPSD